MEHHKLSCKEAAKELALSIFELLCEELERMGANSPEDYIKSKKASAFEVAQKNIFYTNKYEKTMEKILGTFIYHVSEDLHDEKLAKEILRHILLYFSQEAIEFEVDDWVELALNILDDYIGP